MHNIGFMQGRLTDVTNGVIQEFPVDNWKNEIIEASSLGFNIIEWTLDYHNFSTNPFITYQGRDSIAAICNSFNMSIPSVTCDCFMQMPFWKTINDDNSLFLQFYEVCIAASHLGTNFLVVPLVDNGSLESCEQEKFFIDNINNLEFFLKRLNIQLLFESDYNPTDLSAFIDKFSTDTVGINYDIGNSASLGFSPSQELECYGDRVHNVHVKDRKYGGSSVPLLTGDADFDAVFKCLNKLNYTGNFILQTARSDSQQHQSVLSKYKAIVQGLVNKYL